MQCHPPTLALVRCRRLVSCAQVWFKVSERLTRWEGHDRRAAHVSRAGRTRRPPSNETEHPPPPWWRLRTVTPSLTVGRAVASFSSSNAAVAQIRCIAGMTTGLGDTELGSEKLLASMDVRGWALHSQGGLGWALSR